MLSLTVHWRTVGMSLSNSEDCQSYATILLPEKLLRSLASRSATEYIAQTGNHSSTIKSCNNAISCALRSICHCRISWLEVEKAAASPVKFSDNHPVHSQKNCTPFLYHSPESNSHKGYWFDVGAFAREAGNYSWPLRSSRHVLWHASQQHALPPSCFQIEDNRRTWCCGSGWECTHRLEVQHWKNNRSFLPKSSLKTHFLSVLKCTTSTILDFFERTASGLLNSCINFLSLLSSSCPHDSRWYGVISHPKLVHSLCDCTHARVPGTKWHDMARKRLKHTRYASWLRYDGRMPTWNIRGDTRERWHDCKQKRCSPSQPVRATSPAPGNGVGDHSVPIHILIWFVDATTLRLMLASRAPVWIGTKDLSSPRGKLANLSTNSDRQRLFETRKNIRWLCRVANHPLNQWRSAIIDYTTSSSTCNVPSGWLTVAGFTTCLAWSSAVVPSEVSAPQNITMFWD